MNGKIPIDINKILFNNDNNNMEIVKKQQKVVDILMSSSTDKPPPLPPRNNTLCASTSNNSSTNSAPPLDPDAVNSINKQMSYPLVATCATLVNNYVSNKKYKKNTLKFVDIFQFVFIKNCWPQFVSKFFMLVA